VSIVNGRMLDGHFYDTAGFGWLWVIKKMDIDKSWGFFFQSGMLFRSCFIGLPNLMLIGGYFQGRKSTGKSQQPVRVFI